MEVASYENVVVKKTCFLIHIKGLSLPPSLNLTVVRTGLDLPGDNKQDSSGLCEAQYQKWTEDTEEEPRPHGHSVNSTRASTRECASLGKFKWVR